MGRHHRDITPSSHSYRRTERRRSRSVHKEDSRGFRPNSFKRASHQATNEYRRSHANCLGVFGISSNTTERDLHRIFLRYGAIERVLVVRHPNSGISRCFGFVYMSNHRDAVIAKEQCDGMLFDNRNIRVDFSKTNRPHSPTPGRYKGNQFKRERPCQRFPSPRSKYRQSRSPTPHSKHRYRRIRSDRN
ncbi:transformer-2 sex-determining protein-like [Malaya genurostris]|uniref:transformer-2 sex-determining protein-like n=1 Tax=Malaya genurostris TaxID=325434 RepID=UPI0026F3D5E8|nr:transformer-2 sex-determining protein-like [Malaya genurostris]